MDSFECKIVYTYDTILKKDNFGGFVDIMEESAT